MHTLGDALDCLTHLGEIARLPHGFWLPAPLRRVPIRQDVALIIGPHATGELERMFGPIRVNYGFGRLAIGRNRCASIPTQDLGHWIGFSESLREWTISHSRHAMISMQKTVAHRGWVEVYTSPMTRGHNAAYERRWHAIAAETVKSNQLRARAPYLCRERTTFGQWRYFFATLSGGVVVAESSHTCDFHRFQFGLDLLSRAGSTFSFAVHGTDTTLTFRRRLPPAERKLLAALSTEDPQAGTFTIETDVFGVVKQTLEDLGLNGEQR